MALANDDDVIKTFLSDRADHISLFAMYFATVVWPTSLPSLRKEFTVDAGSTVWRIGHAHLTNELANLIRCPGSTAARP
jgi:hypothetical protein